MRIGNKKLESYKWLPNTMFWAIRAGRCDWNVVMLKNHRLGLGFYHESIYMAKS